MEQDDSYNCTAAPPWFSTIFRLSHKRPARLLGPDEKGNARVVASDAKVSQGGTETGPGRRHMRIHFMLKIMVLEAINPTLATTNVTSSPPGHPTPTATLSPSLHIEASGRSELVVSDRRVNLSRNPRPDTPTTNGSKVARRARRQSRRRPCSIPTAGEHCLTRDKLLPAIHSHLTRVCHCVDEGHDNPILLPAVPMVQALGGWRVAGIMSGEDETISLSRDASSGMSALIQLSSNFCANFGLFPTRTCAASLHDCS
ncbi:unnamed protein product [Protopolystoma xenopodis]|uniref:Uncharacterized protein n=1 Tax=Protopolystoma xenopodis TaxID=117903 RepID=A0A3S5CQM8_9PLAT|nr:unnamed protein product [Protopolystoma xenopodis]